jgi:hypothetical protein
VSESKGERVAHSHGGLETVTRELDIGAALPDVFLELQKGFLSADAASRGVIGCKGSRGLWVSTILSILSFAIIVIV